MKGGKVCPVCGERIKASSLMCTECWGKIPIEMRRRQVSIGKAIRLLKEEISDINKECIKMGRLKNGGES